MTLKEILKLKEAFEQDGRQANGIRLTAEQAEELRHELHLLYGFDSGPWLTTLYGMEVLAIDADGLELVA